MVSSNPFAPLLIKLVRRFVRDTVSAAFYTVRSVFLGIMLIRMSCVFCSFLCLHIGGSHTVCGDCRFVDLLNRAFMTSLVLISAIESSFPGRTKRP